MDCRGLPSPLYLFRAATATNCLVCAGLCVSFFYAQDPLLEVLAMSKYDVHPEREVEIDCLAPLTTQTHLNVTNVLMMDIIKVNSSIDFLRPVELEEKLLDGKWPLPASRFIIKMQRKTQV